MRVVGYLGLKGQDVTATEPRARVNIRWVGGRSTYYLHVIEYSMADQYPVF